MTALFLLGVLVAAVLATALVAAPLRRRSPRTWLALMATVPVMSLALYQVLGTPAALDADARRPATAGLDPVLRVRIWDMLRDIAAGSCTVNIDRNHIISRKGITMHCLCEMRGISHCSGVIVSSGISISPIYR